MYASVAIDIQTNNLKDVYDYIVPEELINYVGIGSRVKVDFGVRRVLGYIIELKNETSYTGEMKEIAEVLDFSKELTIEQIELAKKIAHDTKCPLIKALDVMFPPFLKTKFRKFISIKNANFLDPNIFVLFNNKKKICLTSDLVKKYPRISREIQNGNLELEYDVYSYGKNKKIKMYSLNESCENIYKDFTGVRKDIVKYIDRKGQVTLEELKEFVGCSNYIVSSMVKDEYLIIKEVDLINEKIKDKTKLVNLKFDFRKKEIKDKYNIMGNKPFLFSCNDDGFANELYLDICIDNYISIYQNASSKTNINAERPNSYLWPYITRYLGAKAFSSQYTMETDSVPLISFILIAVLFNLVNKWTKMYQCDHIPFTEALKDEQCREYFGMKVKEYDKRK